MARPEVLQTSTPDETLVVNLLYDNKFATLCLTMLCALIFWLDHAFIKSIKLIGRTVLMKYWHGTIRSDGAQPSQANIVFTFAYRVITLHMELHTRCVHKVLGSQKFQTVRQCLHHARRVLW